MSSRKFPKIFNGRPGVYHILHMPSGKRYIGASKNCTNRYTHHRFQLRNGKHSCPKLQKLWDETSEHEWEFMIQEPCEEAELDSKETLHQEILPEDLLLNEMIGQVHYIDPIKAHKRAMKTWQTRWKNNV